MSVSAGVSEKGVCVVFVCVRYTDNGYASHSYPYVCVCTVIH